MAKAESRHPGAATTGNSVIASFAMLYEALLHLYGASWWDVTSGFFVDIGAYDGETKSCTAPLADGNWSGLMFEPGDAPYELCRERHKDNKVKVIKQALSNFNGKLKFYKGTGENGIDFTADPDAHAHYKFKNTNPAKEEYYKDELCLEEIKEQWTHELDVVTLDHFLQSKDFKGSIDVLRISGVGHNLQIMQGLTKWRPAVIVTDHGPDPQNRGKQVAYYGSINYHMVLPMIFSELDTVGIAKTFNAFITDRAWVFVRDPHLFANNEHVFCLDCTMLAEAMIALNKQGALDPDLVHTD